MIEVRKTDQFDNIRDDMYHEVHTDTNMRDIETAVFKRNGSHRFFVASREQLPHTNKMSPFVKRSRSFARSREAVNFADAYHYNMINILGDISNITDELHTLYWTQ